jgi:hypothetical protein
MLLAKYREKFLRKATPNNFFQFFSISIHDDDFKSQNFFLIKGMKRKTISMQVIFWTCSIPGNRFQGFFSHFISMGGSSWQNHILQFSLFSI